MKVFSFARLAGAGAVVCTLGVAAAPSSANSPGYSLSLSGPSSAQSGKSFVLTAKGVDPSDAGPVYLDVDAFDAKVVTSCPGGYDEAYQLAARTNGGVLANSVTEVRDSAGNWSIQVGGSAGDPGAVLICGYSHDTVGNTFASTSFPFTVTSAGQGAGSGTTGSGGGNTGSKGGTKAPRKHCVKFKKTGKGKKAHRRCVKYGR